MAAVELSPALAAFVAERHLGVLVTSRGDGSPHAVPVGFTLDGLNARVITRAGSVKVANARRGGRASITQLDGARWVTFEGEVRVVEDPDAVSTAVAAYAVRYRPPAQREDRVVVEIAIDRVMCSRSLR
jgi:PPOX class probable F420-dependent enzyme